MEKPCLLIYLDDPSLQSRVEEVAGLQSLYVQKATQGDQLSQLVKTFAPFMIILDLTGLNSEWLFRHMGSIRNEFPLFPMVGLVPSNQDDVRDRAEKYGCSQVLTKAEFSKTLPKILNRFLIDRH
jgi:hypothetical protein